MIRGFCFALALAVVGTASAQTGFRYEPVLEAGLEKPIDMVWTADGLVIGGLSGDIYQLRDDAPVSLGKVAVNDKDPGAGLVGVAVHLKEGSGWLFAYYTVKNSLFQRVSRFSLTSTDGALSMGAEEILKPLDELPWKKVGLAKDARNAGAVRVGPVGSLYVGVSDNGQDTKVQDLKEVHGKILRTALDGLPAAENPDFPAGASSRLFAVGFANPYRIGIDSETGDVWVGDGGGLTWSEINKIKGGENGAWPRFEGEGQPGPSGNDLYEGSEAHAPAAVYKHGSGKQSAVVVGAPYRAPAEAEFLLPENFQGAVPVADTFDTWFGFVMADGEGHTLETSEPGPQNVRSIATGADGAVYLLEYVSGGKGRLTRLTWDNDPPVATITQPAEDVRYVAGLALKLVGSAQDKEDGAVTSGFTWEVTLYDGADSVVQEESLTGQEATFTFPAEVDLLGRLEIVLKVKDSAGGQGKTTRTLFPVSTRVTYGSQPEGVPVKLNGEALTERTTVTYAAGDQVVISCEPEWIFEGDNELYVWDSWTGGGEREQTFTVPGDDLDMLCVYKLFGAPENMDSGVNVVVDKGPTEVPDAGAPDTGGGDSCSATGHGNPASLGLILLLVLGLVVRQRQTFCA